MPVIRIHPITIYLDSWPSGNYSFPKPISGCPKFWKEGWLKQDVEDDAIRNGNIKSKFSSSFHMNASINDEFVEREFCTKVADSFDTQMFNPWPKGIL